METIKQKVREFLQKNKKASNLNDNTDLFSSGLVDSLFGLQMVLFVEKEFKIKLNNKDINEDNFRSIENIANTVNRLTQK